MGVKEAMERHHAKLLKSHDKPKRRNKKPEKETESSCLRWMRSLGWDVDVIEAKGGMNQFGVINVKSGFSDVCGNTSNGQAVFVEFKAPGKLRNLKPHQRQFLIKKINTGCFALVTDRVEHLKFIWETYQNYRRRKHFDTAKKYLLSKLPPEPKTKDTPHPELGF
jgi:hypothetical protein